MGKRKLGSAPDGGKAEPRRKPSSAQQQQQGEEEEDKRQRRRPTTHHDEEERAATKALARPTRGDDEAAAASSSDEDSDSDSGYDMDEAEVTAAAAAAAEQGYFDDSSDSGGEEDSEDDIKLYGEGEEEGNGSSEDGREEAAAAVKGKKGAKETAGAAGKDAAAKAQQNKDKGKKGKDKEGVEVSFDFSDPGERFFFGTRALLQWLADEGVETTALAELIGQEKGLGTVVHCTDEDDVFAVAATLNVQAHLTAGDEGMRSLVALVKRKCPPSLQPALDRALASPETYVFLHARFVNLPLPLVPLLHKSGEEDRAWAQKSDPELPRIKTLLALSPCAVDVGSAASLPYAPNDAIYDRFEDELWVQGAELSYCFPRSAGEGEGAEGKGKDAKKGQGKKGKGGTSSGGGHAGSSLGCVVSLVEGSAVAEALPQIEEMVRAS